MAGVYIEFSGPLLAVYKLTRQLMCFAGPLFLVILFWAMPVTSPAAFLLMLLRYAVVFTLLILIRNTNPRLRIDQAMRFFWGKVTIVALIAVGLALLGK
jgi:NADH-quinone oxidoreductase subunit H